MLDLIAKRICPDTAYGNFTTTRFGIDDLSFSNALQLFLMSAFVIAINTIWAKPLPWRIRVAMFMVILLIVFYIIPLSVIYKVT